MRFFLIALLLPIGQTRAQEIIEPGGVIHYFERVTLDTDFFAEGATFGDHCSPISDTTIISSMASASDHIDHVRTQIPFASVGAAVTIVIYLIIA